MTLLLLINVLVSKFIWSAVQHPIHYSAFPIRYFRCYVIEFIYCFVYIIYLNSPSEKQNCGKMPKYYCDYCDTHLTHNSPSVRKTHCGGRKHKDNVRMYYQNWVEEQV